jgi:fatty-acyl-CoA synthase
MKDLELMQMRAIPADSIYEQHLDKNSANYVPLAPVSFLKRAADVYPDHVAVIHGTKCYTYTELQARARRLASALEAKGVTPGDTVSIMSPNTPAMIEAHYAVPSIGAVLNPLNIRLDAKTIAFILGHAETKVLLTDREFAPVVSQALAMLPKKPFIIDIDDLATSGERLGEVEYEVLLESGDPKKALDLPADEWQAIILSYTSGTTGDPKGVVYHHRGVYLNALTNIAAWSMEKHPVYLWTLPMFHSLGWCFPWTIPIIGGTQVCLRKVEARTIYELIAKHGVTHMSGAPIVLNTLVNAKNDEIRAFPQCVKVTTAASPPPPSIIEKIEARGFEVLHLYGLTEVFGPMTICEWQNAWNDLPADRRAEMKARQGVAYPSVEEVRVVDPKTLIDVPNDGTTIGEVVERSNTIMRGYLKNPRATKEAFEGGYFRSGDLAVRHPDGYIELKDRSKDIIISGGENISTIEVESILYRHPAILEAAVVARPDEKWGETPCAFVNLRDGASASAEDIIAFCRQHLAAFKTPKTVVFGQLPKTSTGKVQKFILRQKAKEF